MKSIAMRRLISAAVLATAAATSGGGIAYAQESVPASAAENAHLWFVEFSNPPTIEGTSLGAVRADKANFRAAARAAGIVFTERLSYDALFNGLSISVSAADRLKLMRLPGVKAIYPVEIDRRADARSTAPAAAPDLPPRSSMTGADIAQNQLGLTGNGHQGRHHRHRHRHRPSGLRRLRRAGHDAVPERRVVAGYDFVGDAYNAAGTAADAARFRFPTPIPDDCNGHGTHVAGIVGANGGGIKGVAPEVSLGAYRVFGCDGSTSPTSSLAALERAYADGMQIINQSLGSARQWPQYPTAQAPTRLVNKGVVMVTSIGNNGPGGTSPDALFAAGAPGIGDKVIGVASYDNAPALRSSVTGTPYGYNAATGSPPPPTSGSLPMATTGTHDDRRRRLRRAAGRQPDRHGGADPPRHLLVLHQGLQRAERGRGRRRDLQQRAGALDPDGGRHAADHDPGGRRSPTAHGATLDGLIAAGRRRSPGRRRPVALPVRHRRPDLGLQLLRPRAGPRPEAEHRRPGRLHLLDLSARARRHGDAFRHLDVVAARCRRRGADARGPAEHLAQRDDGALQNSPIRRTGPATPALGLPRSHVPPGRRHARHRRRDQRHDHGRAQPDRARRERGRLAHRRR